MILNLSLVLATDLTKTGTAKSAFVLDEAMRISVADKDDLTGEPLVKRVDDMEKTVRKRLDVYSQQTKPLIDWFKNYELRNSTAKFVQVIGICFVESI